MAGAEPTYEFPVNAPAVAPATPEQSAARRRRTILRFAWLTALLVALTALGVVLGAESVADAWPQFLVVALAAARIASLSWADRRSPA